LRINQLVQWTLLCIPLLAWAALSNPAWAQQELMEAYGRASKALEAGRYLEAAETLRPLAIDAQGKIINPTAFQLWNQIQIDITGETFHSAGDAADGEDRLSEQQLVGARPVDAIGAIVERARRTRIVIINEDHSSPKQRAFALEVAKALKPLGYTKLAVEAFNNSGDAASRMSALKKRGYPVLSDGVYTREPVFADFIRQALRFGYQPVSYEDVDQHVGLSDVERMRAREDGQANNLFQALKAAPGAKFLVYVGVSHVAEKALPTGETSLLWMAGRLVRRSGINPVTIDQTTLESGCDVCRRLASSTKAPVVFYRREKPIVVGQYSGAVDLQVFKPQVARVAGRPGWLLAMGRTPSPVPAKLLHAGNLRLVQAFVASEGPQAIPVDQLLVRSGAQPRALMLPRMKVRFAVQDAPERRQ